MIPAEAVEAAAIALDPRTMSSGGALAEKFKAETRAEARRILEAAAPHMAPDPAKCAILPQCLVGAYTDGYCDGMSGDKHNLDKYEATQ